METKGVDGGPSVTPAMRRRPDQPPASDGQQEGQ